MKLTIDTTSRFRKDYKLAVRRGYDMSILESVVEMLARGELLPEKYCDHDLIGNYKGCRECHLKPDWLLVYQIFDDELILLLTRTGSHNDIF